MSMFGNRIRLLASKLGKEEQQLAKDLSLTKSQLSHYVNGNRKVPSELLQKIVNLYGINPVFLFKEDAPLYIKEVTDKKFDEYTYYPVEISAGLPNDVEGITETDTITLPDSLMGKYAGSKDIFITRVNGESMNKVIPHNSLIAVRPVSQESLKTGDILVYRKDSEYAVKRLVIDDGKYIFKPESTDDRFYDDVVTDDQEIAVKGKVVMSVIMYD